MDSIGEKWPTEHRSPEGERRAHEGPGEGDGDGHPDRLVAVHVDGSRVTSPRETTAGELLVAAGLDPTSRQLVLVHGRHQTPYAAGDPLKLHPGMVFITVSTGPTPVS